MKKRDLLKKNRQLHEEKWELEAELTGKNEEIIQLTSELRKTQRIANNLVKESDEGWNEICELKDKIYNMQADKDKCIEFIKKQKCMLMHSEDEITRLNGEINRLTQNIQALCVSIQENDQAYYKLVETNAFLAGQVKVYENLSKSDAAETAH